MPRKSAHVCSDGGAQEAKWHGQCPACGAWNTLVEEALPQELKGGSRRLRAGGGSSASEAPARLRDVGSPPLRRTAAGSGELRRVSAGRLGAGATTALGGRPRSGNAPAPHH